MAVQPHLKAGDMNMEPIRSELTKMNIDYKSIRILQEKDGIVVARIHCANKSFVMKLFQRPAFRREIGNYKILSSLHIPTLNIISATDKALLMEDVGNSNTYRLGIDKDLDDPEIAVLIAKWYKQLHHKGYKFIEQNGHVPLYDENDLLTIENIEEIKWKTGTSELPVWESIERNFDFIEKRLYQAKRTLTYNDFYYTNLIVAQNRTLAMMFDYNLLGKGYAYADIRNVCFSLSEAAKKAFLEEYGVFNAAEVIIDNVASVLITLHSACRKSLFPAYANNALKELHTDLMDKVDRLLALEK